ncbi:hypothetical protein ACTXT7_016802 [Hymenolepis weldensis]
MDNLHYRYFLRHGYWPQLSQLLDWINPDPPNQQLLAESSVQTPSATNTASSTAHRFSILEALLDEPAPPPLTNFVSYVREYVPLSPNTAQKMAEEDAARFRYTSEFISQNRALEDPNYLEHRLNELKLGNRGNAWTKARVKQWVARNYPTNALALTIPQTTTQLPSMQQHSAPYPTVAMANYYLHNLYPFNPYFQGAMSNYSVGYVPMHPQPAGNPNSQMRNTVSISVGASTSQTVFERPRAPPQPIQLEQTRNVYLAGPPSTANTDMAGPSTRRTVTSREESGSGEIRGLSLIKDLPNSQQ